MRRPISALYGLGRAEGLGIDRGELQLVGTETLEELLATGENQDLDALCGVREDVEHQPHPLVVGKDERIVQDHSGGCALVNQHLSEGQANEDGDLFLSTHAQMIETFFVSRHAGYAGDVQVFVYADFGVGEQHLEVRMDAIDDWGEVAFSGVALGCAKRFG